MEQGKSLTVAVAAEDVNALIRWGHRFYCKQKKRPRKMCGLFWEAVMPYIGRISPVCQDMSSPFRKTSNSTLYFCQLPSSLMLHSM